MSVLTQTDLLIVGAGPFGLALAAQAKARGMSPLVVGRPMSFWHEHMPHGMILRSRADWHLDAEERFTFLEFCQQEGHADAANNPIPVELFCQYAAWFQRQCGIDVQEKLLDSLSRVEGMFEATTNRGETIRAKAVVCTPGYRYFRNLPSL